MERNFYNEEFEDLIQQKAGQYKMYPSDKVWKNINASLHTRKRWFIAGMFTLISGILFFAGKELIFPTNHPVSTKKLIDKSVNSSNINNEEISVAEPNSSSVNKIVEIPVISSFEFKSSNKQVEKTNDAGTDATVDPSSTLLAVNPAEPQQPFSSNNLQEGDGSDNDFASKWKHDFYANKIDIAEPEKSSADLHPNTPSSMNPELKTGDRPISSSMELDKKQMRLLENTAPYELGSPKKLNRKYWQLYISPTVTYRALSGAAFVAAKTDIQNGPIAATSQDANPNLYTNNKPALGLEIGSSLLYKLTRNLSVKAGLQFNYSRYTINAYVSNPQPATIALNSFNGYQNNTITAYTNIGTVGGKAAVNLQNQYFQLSLPVGFELRIIGNEKLQLNIGGTVQPTYLLNRDSYLLTSDYTNYTQEPSLFRKWNVNGAVEAFISYNTGRIRWQVGPQFRYQLFSTYTSDYPITENLKGFGFKIGISKTIW